MLWTSEEDERTRDGSHSITSALVTVWAGRI